MVMPKVIISSAVPIVVFVGPPASGKTMTIVRLAQYLFCQGYTIQTDPTFLNTKTYRLDCEEFIQKLHTNIALDGPAGPIMVNIYKGDHLIAKILDVPNNAFNFIDQCENTDWIYILEALIRCNNPKTYVILLDLDSKICFRNSSVFRNAYTNYLLTQLYPKIQHSRDHVILLYNKIDATIFGTSRGCHNPNGARKDAEMYYAALFSAMRRSLLGGLLMLDNFTFKTFCVGVFNNHQNYQTYSVADDIYPEDLWHDIIKGIKLV